MTSKLKYIIPLAAVILGLSSCKKFLDINHDPNNPTAAPVSLLLTGAERTLGDALAMGGGENGGLSNILEIYVHRISTREEPDQYGAIGSNFYLSLAWPKFYASTPPAGESAPLSGIFQNLEEIIQQSSADGNLWYRGVAKVLKAYSYSQLVDVFGDVPYSEANKLDSTPAVIYPKFDKGSDIYPKLIVLLDEAIADLSTGEAGNVIIPASDDVIYGTSRGNADGVNISWIKAANTIKLKLYTQMRKVQDVSAQVNALLGSPETLIATGDESFLLPYGLKGATDDRNPAFAEYFATQRSNHISPWFYEIMKGKNNDILKNNPDPRIPYYWFNQLTAEDPPENATEYRDSAFVSIYFGSVGPDRDRNNQNSLSVIGLYPAGGRYDDGQGGAADATFGTGAAPYRFVTYADRLYLEAELINQGIATGNARDVLEQALLESFKQVDVVVNMDAPSQSVPQLMPGGTPAAEVQTYIDNVLAEFDAGNPEKQLRVIMTEKWISSFGSAIDAYTDYRRTGYPVLFDPSNPTMAPGGLVQPPVHGDPHKDADGNLVNDPQKRVQVLISVPYPLSLPWYKGELETNKNAPSQKTPGTYKVFWMP